MTTRWIETLVGLFIVAGLLSLLYLALSVSGLSGGVSNESYQVKALFSNVGGLTKRAEVSLAGVTIGKVSSIRLDPEEKIAEVTMEIDGSVNFLPTDSSASILTAGLLGEKYIGFQLGADEEHLSNDDYVLDTQSAVVLEDLIGQFLVGSGKEQ